jgi:hypothetical protein
MLVSRISVYMRVNQKAVVSVTLGTCIMEVLNSNLGLATGCPDRGSIILSSP